MKAERRDRPAEVRSGRRPSRSAIFRRRRSRRRCRTTGTARRPPARAGAFYPRSGKLGSGRSPLKADFGPGFRFETDDDEFRLQVHFESQIEARIWAQGDQVPANSGFFLPRQRIFFNGNITKPIEYEFSINRGLNNINLLNAYINFHFDDRFQLRFGRFFTPLTYDQYAISNYWLPTPERSLFTTNVGLNRQIGLMALGLPLRQAARLRGRHLQRLAQLVREPQQRVDFVGVPQREAVPGVGVAADSPSS